MEIKLLSTQTAKQTNGELLNFLFLQRSDTCLFLLQSIMIILFFHLILAADDAQMCFLAIKLML